MEGTTRKEFTYDGGGRRVRLRSLTNGQVERDSTFVFCDFEICQERSSLDSVVRTFYSLGLLEGATQKYVVQDHLGSVRQVTSQAGQVTFTADYDPFGRVLATSGDSSSSARFAQLAALDDSGLLYGTYREYDASLGRWLKADPIGFGGGDVNLYSYARNSTLNRTDALGLACSEVARWPVGLWRLLSTTRTYGKKRLDGDPQYEGPEEGPNFRGAPGTRSRGSLFAVVTCRWTRDAKVTRVYERPVVVMEVCDSDCGPFINFRQTYEKRTDTSTFQDRGGFGIHLPIWVPAVLAGDECKKRLGG